MRWPRRHGRTIATVLLVVGGSALLAGGAFWYAGSHQVLPGTGGCTLVREPAPRAECMEEELGAIMRERGVEDGLAEVDELAREEPLVLEHCHVAMHPVGEADGAEAARGGDPVPALATSTVCEEGYAHGFVIGYLEEAPRHAEPAAVVDLCGGGGEGGDRDDRAANCIHAYGHVLVRANEELPDALAGCDELGPALRAAGLATGMTRDCAWGAHMEQAFADRGRFDELADAASADEDPCRVLDERHRGTCYAFVPVRVGILGGDEQLAARACDEQPRDERHAAACAGAWGGSVARADACTRFAAGRVREACVHGAERAGASGAPASIEVPPPVGG